MNAAANDASVENEQNAVLMRTAKGIQVLFVQVAGFIARRIVCHTQAGDQLTTGQRMGLIRFGSRVDVYVPCDAQVRVQLKQKVTAGESILAQLAE